MQMRDFILLLVVLTSSFTSAREREHKKVNVVIGHGGLVLITCTHDGFALAADGSSFNADGTVSIAEKLLPVGKQGALAFGGTVAIQDPVGKAFREEVNVSRIAAAWLQAHPDVALDAAGREINSVVNAAVTKFFFTRDPGSDAAKYKFSIILAGFVNDKPVITETRYFIPTAKGNAPRTSRVAGNINPGAVVVAGSPKVEAELLRGSSSALPDFKKDPAIARLRASRPENLSSQEFIAVFETILRAAESEEGKRFDGTGAVVAPPHKFATITAKEGFAWRRAESARNP